MAIGLASALAGPPDAMAASALDERAEAWAAEDAAVLVRSAPRLVDSAVAVPFEAMEGRVGAYADWVYGWLSSLLTAWEIGYAGVAEAGQEIYAGRLPDGAIVRGRVEQVVQERFEAIVIAPERTDRALSEGWQRSMQRLAAFDESLAAERRQRIQQAAAALGVDAGAALRRHGGRLLSASIVESPPPGDLSREALEGVEADAGGTADRVLIRSFRPLATRALSVTTRLFLAPAAGSALAAPVLSVNGLGAALATMTAAWAAIWGVDYTLNAIDTAVTRPGFEADLRMLVRDAHGEASRLARRHAHQAACGALGVAVPAAACAPQPAIAAAGRSG